MHKATITMTGVKTIRNRTIVGNTSVKRVCGRRCTRTPMSHGIQTKVLGVDGKDHDRYDRKYCPKIQIYACVSEMHMDIRCRSRWGPFLSSDLVPMYTALRATPG